jgi:hypothetical protein
MRVVSLTTTGTWRCRRPTGQDNVLATPQIGYIDRPYRGLFGEAVTAISDWLDAGR